MNPAEIPHPMSRIAGQRDRRRMRHRLTAALGLALLVSVLAGVAGYLQMRLPAIGEQPERQHALLSVPDAGPPASSGPITEFERQKTEARLEPLPDQF
jgi:hypothetical protein